MDKSSLTSDPYPPICEVVLNHQKPYCVKMSRVTDDVVVIAPTRQYGMENPHCRAVVKRLPSSTHSHTLAKIREPLSIHETNNHIYLTFASVGTGFFGVLEVQ